MKMSRICLALFLLALCAPAFGNPGAEMSIWTNCSQQVSAQGETCPAKKFPSTTCNLPVEGVDLSSFSPGCTVGAINGGAVKKFRGMWVARATLLDPEFGEGTTVDIPLGRWNTRGQGEASVLLPTKPQFVDALEGNLGEFLLMTGYW